MQTNKYKDEVVAVLDSYYDDVIGTAGSDKSDEQVELAILQLQREATTKLKALIDKQVVAELEGILKRTHTNWQEVGEQLQNRIKLRATKQGKK